MNVMAPASNATRKEGHRMRKLIAIAAAVALMVGAVRRAEPRRTHGRPLTVVPGSRPPLQRHRRAPRAGHPRRFRARGPRYNGVRYGDGDERGPSGPDGRSGRWRTI